MRTIRGFLGTDVLTTFAIVLRPNCRQFDERAQPEPTIDPVRSEFLLLPAEPSHIDDLKQSVEAAVKGQVFKVYAAS